MGGSTGQSPAQPSIERADTYGSLTVLKIVLAQLLLALAC